MVNTVNVYLKSFWGIWFSLLHRDSEVFGVGSGIPAVVVAAVSKKQNPFPKCTVKELNLCIFKKKPPLCLKSLPVSEQLALFYQQRKPFAAVHSCGVWRATSIKLGNPSQWACSSGNRCPAVKPSVWFHCGQVVFVHISAALNPSQVMACLSLVKSILLRHPIVNFVRSTSF